LASASASDGDDDDDGAEEKRRLLLLLLLLRRLLLAPRGAQHRPVFLFVYKWWFHSSGQSELGLGVLVSINRSTHQSMID
jgi:hypothetical protein